MLGWLSPEGIFYECEFMGHVSKAIELLKKVYSVETNYAQRLADLGWCAIQSGFVGFPDNPHRETPLFTDAQKKWLERNRKNMSYGQNMALDISLETDELLRERNGGYWERPKI